MRFVRTGPSSAPPRSQGIHKGAAAPLVGGAGGIDACQRFLLARSVLRRGGNLPRPGLPLGENGKGDEIPCCRRLFLVISLSSDSGPPAAFLCFLCNQFDSSLLCPSTSVTPLASIRTLK